MLLSARVLHTHSRYDRFGSSGGDPEVQIKAQDLSKDLVRRKAQLYQMENFLPRENDVYLKVILGSVNVSILNKNDRRVSGPNALC